MRTFISLNIESIFKRKIKEIKDTISNELFITNPDSVRNLKWEEENKYHITLLFIGETEKNIVKKIEKILSGLNPFSKPIEISFQINSLNAFPNFRYPRVLILDIYDESGCINTLSESMRNCMSEHGFKSDKPFHPHITLARVRRDRKVNMSPIKKFIIPELKFTVNKFSLMESRLSSKGAEHILIRDFNF